MNENGVRDLERGHVTYHLVGSQPIAFALHYSSIQALDGMVSIRAFQCMID